MARQQPAALALCLSHARVARAVASLREGPVDVAHRALDPAGLAVQAVREVDLEFPVLKPVHLRRTEPRAGRAESAPALIALGGIADLQRARLVLLVHRAAHEHVRKPVWHDGG